LTLATTFVAALDPASRSSFAQKPTLPDAPPAFFTPHEQAVWFQTNQPPEALAPFTGTPLEDPSVASKHLSGAAAVAADFVAKSAGQFNAANDCAAELQPRTSAAEQIVADFVAANPHLTLKDVQDLRVATRGIALRVVHEITDPRDAALLQIGAIDPIIRLIQTDPLKSTFQNEDVTKLTSASDHQPFSNFAMHLAPDGQEGLHSHPGPRDLLVMSNTSWYLLFGRSAQVGEDLTDIKRVARIRIGAGQYAVSFPANRPHGFDSEGTGTVAYSIHAFDKEELSAAGTSDSKDVMAKLTSELGAEGLEIIGGVDVPARVVLALHAQVSA
jgi:hypothetical protein